MRAHRAALARYGVFSAPVIHTADIAPMASNRLNIST